MGKNALKLPYYDGSVPLPADLLDSLSKHTPKKDAKYDFSAVQSGNPYIFDSDRIPKKQEI